MNKLSDKNFILIILIIVLVAYLVVFIGIDISNEIDKFKCISDEALAYADSYDIESGNYDYAYMICEDDYILNDSSINVLLVLNTNKIICDYSIQNNGFDDYFINELNTDKWNISLGCLHYGDDLEFHITLDLSNNSSITASLYAIYNEYGIFVSGFSKEDALEKYINYALEYLLITEWDADKIRVQNLYKNEPYQEDVTINNNLLVKNTLNTNSTSNVGDTEIYGILRWSEGITENDPTHPLRGVKVEIRDSDTIGSKLLGTVYTDNGGNYSLKFNNDSSVLENGGYDLFLRVYAGDDNAYVVKGDGITRYYIDSQHTAHQDVLTGSSTSINLTFKMTSDERKAMQISQALLTARDFAKEMKNAVPTSVKVRYPYGTDGCYYNNDNGMITITGVARNTTNVPESYASWDVIMHEYGHHMSYELDIIDSPGGRHAVDINMLDHYMSDQTEDVHDYDCAGKCARHRGDEPISKTNAKEEAFKLIWSEAWATTFAFVAQEYYATLISDISTVCNSMYDAYNFSKPYDYATNARDIQLGEYSEVAVYSTLWDLLEIFVNNEEASTEAEKLEEGIKKWWDITTISQVYIFSDFITNFYEQYPEYIGDIGYALEEYNIAATMSVDEDDIVELNTTMTSFDIEYSIDTSDIEYYKPDKFYVTVFSEDYSEYYTSPLLTSDTYTISSTTFAMVKTFVGETVHIAFRTIQSGASPGYSNVAQGVFTGPYYSHVIDVPKRIFTTSVSNDKVTITGTYCDIVGNMTIPEKIDGKTVTAIGDNAFSYQVDLKNVYFENYSTVTSIGHSAFAYCAELTLIRIPDNVEEIKDSTFAWCENLLWTYGGDGMTRIGNFAFYETRLPGLFTIEPSVKTIGQSAFYNSDLPENFYLPANTQLETLGNYAFSGNGDLKSLVLSDDVETIGDYCFQNCDNLTIYTEYTSKPTGWSNSWNSSNRTAVWGCTLSGDKSYVISFAKSFSNPSNTVVPNGISNPYRKDYTFGGWYTTSDFSGTKYDDILSAPNGILYAKWTQESCVAEGTLITLANGSQVAVEDLTGNEQLLVWNMLTGEFDVAPILFIDSDSVMQYEIIELTFSDGTQVKVIDEHAFFDVNLNKYVFLREDAYQYIGHYFNKQGYDGDGNMIWTTVQLVDVDIYTETTTAWSPVTYGHLCYYVNGMLSMPGATQGFINIFEVDTETMRYDMTAYNNDINTYGLFTYEEFCLEVIEIPEVIFNAFNGQYLKVAIGKNLIDEEGIIQLVERYSEFF